jgi:hypothetical protein
MVAAIKTRNVGCSIWISKRIEPGFSATSEKCHSLTSLRAPMVAGYPGSPPERSPLASLLRSSCRQ